jgi:hypothetical protein
VLSAAVAVACAAAVEAKPDAAVLRSALAVATETGVVAKVMLVVSAAEPVT